MKKLFIFFIALVLTASVDAQKNPIDELFDKYSGQDGFTTVYISSRMFSMFAGIDSSDPEFTDLMQRLKSIRILSVEDTVKYGKLDFHAELGKKVDYSTYEDLMLVKSGAKTVRFLVKYNGDRFSELLMVTSGGGGGSSLISIKGDLDMKNITDISKTMGIEDLKAVEKSNPQPRKK